MMTPVYRDIEPHESPLLAVGGTSVRVLGGTLALDGNPVSGPIGERDTEPYLFDAELETGASFETPFASTLSAIVYVHRGHIAIGTTTVAERHAAILGGGESLAFTALEPAGFLVLAGRPLREPVA